MCIRDSIIYSGGKTEDVGNIRGKCEPTTPTNLAYGKILFLPRIKSKLLLLLVILVFSPQSGWTTGDLDEANIMPNKSSFGLTRFLSAHARVQF